MIYDQLANLGNYQGLNPNLDTAIHYLLSHELAGLPIGRTEVDGERVYINCMEVATAAEESKDYELHRQYMDIQIDLEGAERILIGDASLMEAGEYHEDGDYALAACPRLSDCTLGAGRFIICMAGEPHKPGVAAKNEGKVKKCVVKVHL